MKRQGSEMKGSKHSSNVICSWLPHESNFDLILSFPNILTLTHFQRIHLAAFVMILPCILMMTHQTILSFLCLLQTYILYHRAIFLCAMNHTEKVHKSVFWASLKEEIFIQTKWIHPTFTVDIWYHIWSKSLKIIREMKHSKSGHNPPNMRSITTLSARKDKVLCS
jgi:hypothetical protein